MFVKLSWTNFKQMVDSKKLILQYTGCDSYYRIWAKEGSDTYECVLPYFPKDSEDLIEFEAYKSAANTENSPTDDNNKPYVRSGSRPLDMTTCFVTSGDDTAIGNGTVLKWNVAEDTFTTVADGFKEFTLDFGFNDEICIKEGTIYWWDTDWYAKIRLESYVPAAYSPTGSDLTMDRFVSHLMYDSCPVGDELNTEEASAVIPAYIRHRIVISLKQSDTTSKGYVSLELYRKSTV